YEKPDLTHVKPCARLPNHDLPGQPRPCSALPRPDAEATVGAAQPAVDDHPRLLGAVALPPRAPAGRRPLPLNTDGCAMPAAAATTLSACATCSRIERAVRTPSARLAQASAI